MYGIDYSIFTAYNDYMSLFNELKRRNVFRVTAAYVVVSWLLLQVGDVVFEALELEASANRLLMAIVLLGLIPTILFSWAFEMTPDGIKRDKDVDSDNKQDPNTAKKLDYVTLGVLIVVGCMSLWQHWSDEPVVNVDIRNQKVLSEDLIGIKPIDDKSVAVLPFTNVANTEENQPFTVGIHDDLITTLSKISALKVISRTSVLTYNTIDLPLKEIAKKLGVAHIVEAGVQRVGNQVRLNVKLVDAKTEKPLWAESYNREITTTNIFKIQSEISQEIAIALKAQLTEAEVQSLGKQHTDNLDAYNAYLAGRQRLLSRNTTTLVEALSLFEKATELDPLYALAYVGQADTWSLLNNYSDVSEAEMIEKGEPLLNKALELDPMLAEAHTSQANYFAEKDELVMAEKAFKHSLTLNPNYPTTYHWYGNLLSRLGKKQKALEMYKKAVELDPVSPVIQVNIGSMLSDFGLHQEALDQFDRIDELVPDFPGSASGKAEVYSNMGKLDEAITWQRIAIKRDPGNLSRKISLTSLYLDIGLPDLAEETITEIDAQSPGYPDLIYVLSQLDLFNGNYQKAADRFEEAFKKEPKNYNYLGNLAFYKMLLKQHDEAIAIYLKIYPGKFEKEFEVRLDNFDSTANLIWLWKATGMIQKANDLLAELRQLMSEYPDMDIASNQAMVAALEDNYELSGELYISLYKKGESRGFWRGNHMPMLEEVMKYPLSQEIMKIYDFETSQQRNRVLSIVQN